MPKSKPIHAAAKSTPTKSVFFTALVDILAAVEEGGKKGPRKFTTKAYGGGTLAVNGWPLPVVVDLAGLTPDSQIIANLHHDKKQLVGHGTESTNDGKQLILAGVVSGTGPAAQEFTGNHDNGFPWQASVEVRPSARHVEEIAAGKKVSVNGQTFVGPIYVARKSTLYGVAFLPHGTAADGSTTVTLAAGAAHPQDGDTNVEFTKWIEAMHLSPADLNDKQTAALQVKYDAEIAAAAAADKGDIKAAEFSLDDIREQIDEHRVNLDLIFATREDDTPAKKFGEIKAEALKGVKDLKAKALKEKWAGPRFEVEAIKAASAIELKLVEAAAAHTGPAIHASTRDATPDVIEAALCLNRGMPNVDKLFKPEVLDSAGRHFKNLGLQQAMIMAAAQNGFVCRPGERIHAGNIREVLEYAFPPRHIHAASSISLSGIMSNVANKELLSGFTEEDQTWRMIAKITTATDFKARTAYRMLDDMEYEELANDGKIKHGKLSEQSFTRTLKTFAKMFALTRQDIINDDLGAFDDLRSRLGRGAAKKFNNLFWATFMNNAALFSTDNGNYITGATTNLGLDGVGLGLGIAAFRALKSPATDGAKRIGGNPSILLVPPELEGISETLFRNTNLGSVKNSDANIYQNKYKPIVVPWLSDSAFTGNSATAWFLLRNPADLAAMVVSFLNGNQSPTVESADAVFDELGVEFRGYHDFGIDQAEPLAGIKSKGAA